MFVKDLFKVCRGTCSRFVDELVQCLLMNLFNVC